MTCSRCKARGSAPKCAFGKGQEFSPDNWMCGTMDALRDIVGTPMWNHDQYAALLRMPAAEGFLVLGWYKNRVCTEVALVIDGDRTRQLTLEDAEEILKKRGREEVLKRWSDD